MTNKKDAITAYIENHIQNKLYSPGQIIPSESEFCRMFHVSRMTVRKALDELVAQGVLYKEKGRGTFVSQKPRFNAATALSRKHCAEDLCPRQKLSQSI